MRKENCYKLNLLIIIVDINRKNNNLQFENYKK
jgi:hypothetical protein